MESLFTQGIIHIQGALLWITGITLLSLEIFRNAKKAEGRKLGSRMNFDGIVMTGIAMVLVGSSGLFFLYEWDIWKRLQELQFWWVHSMILTWILFGVVLFFLDPLILKRYE